MRKDAPKHIAQDIVDKVFLELRCYDEDAEKTMDPRERYKIDRRRKQLLKELSVLLAQSKNHV